MCEATFFLWSQMDTMVWKWRIIEELHSYVTKELLFDMEREGGREREIWWEINGYQRNPKQRGTKSLTGSPPPLPPPSALEIKAMYGITCFFVFFLMPMAYFYFEEKDEVAGVTIAQVGKIKFYLPMPYFSHLKGYWTIVNSCPILFSSNKFPLFLQNSHNFAATLLGA